MPTRVTCGGCGRGFRTGDDLAGKRGRCPDCGNVILIPLAEPVTKGDGDVSVPAEDAEAEGPGWVWLSLGAAALMLILLGAASVWRAYSLGHSPPSHAVRAEAGQRREEGVAGEGNRGAVTPRDGREEGIPPQSRGAEFSSTVDALKDDSWPVRERAAKALGHIGDARAAGPLVAALRDNDSDVRKAAATALGEIGDGRAVEPLIAALEDDDRVREAAATALAQIGKPAVEPLIATLTNGGAHTGSDLEEPLRQGLREPPMEEALRSVVVRVPVNLLLALATAGVFVAFAKGLRMEKPSFREVLFAAACGYVGASLLAMVGTDLVARLLAGPQTFEYSKANLSLQFAMAVGGGLSATAFLLRKHVQDVKGLHVALLPGAVILISAHVAFVAPLWQGAEEVERRTQCLAHLHKLGLGIELFRHENQGRYPETLAEVAKPEFLLRAPEEVLQCPSASEAGLPLPHYVYSPPASGSDREEDYRLAWDGAGNHTVFGSGRNVLLANMACLWLNEEEFGRQHWRVRAGAAKVLGEIGDVGAIEALISALRDRERDVAAAAASALGRMGKPAAEPLVAALRRSGGRVGWLQVALEEAGEPAVEPLTAALQDHQWLVRVRAANVLGEIADPRAVASLVAALADAHSSVRAAAALALGAIGDARAVEPLMVALQHRDTKLRQEAAHALGELGDPRAVEALAPVLRDRDRTVRRTAALALAEVGGGRAAELLIGALRDGGWELRQTAARALREIGPEAVEPLAVALTDGDRAVRALAAVVLGEIGDARATEPLIAALDDSDSDVRAAVAHALSEMGSRGIDVPEH